MMTTENTWVEAETLHPEEAFQKVVENVAQKAEVEAMVSAYDKPTIIAAFRAIIPELTATEMAVYGVTVTPINPAVSLIGQEFKVSLKV